jgi:sugar-specific transcriptional regulator TrmB
MVSEGDFEGIGLTKNEAKAYLALLRIKEGTGADVATESGIYKANCYDALKRLSAKGLVAEIVKGKVKYFKCLSPSRLEDIANEKAKRIRELTPILERQFLERMEAKEIDILRGNAGYKTLIDIISNCRKRVMARAFYEPHTLQERSSVESYVAKKYRNKKILRKIYKMVYPETPVSRRTITERNKYAFQGNVRYLKQGRQSPVSMGAADDVFWLGFVDKARHERTYLKINSKELSDAFEDMFEMSWEKSKE